MTREISIIYIVMFLCALIFTAQVRADENSALNVTDNKLFENDNQQSGKINVAENNDNQQTNNSKNLENIKENSDLKAESTFGMVHDTESVYSQTESHENTDKSASKNEQKITITGDKMSFQQSDTGNLFDLVGNVRVILPIGELISEELHIVTIPKVGDLSFDCIQSLSAEKNVKLTLDQRVCAAEKLNIFPKENLLHLTGNVKVVDPMATVVGEEVKVNYITREIEILKSSNQKQQVSVEINTSTLDGISSLFGSKPTTEIIPDK